MALIGYLENILISNKFDDSIKAGLKYLSRLNKNNFQNICLNGKEYSKIKGNNIFIINQIYKSKSHSKQKFEGHRKYIDLQYVFEGEEFIKVASLKDCRGISEYDKVKDVQSFDSKSYSVFLMKKGMVSIFYPGDIHAPGLNVNKSCLIKKTVVKVNAGSIRKQ